MSRNIILENLEEDKQLKENLIKHIHDVFNKSDIYFSNEKVNAVLKTGDGQSFLFIKTEKSLSVYMDCNTPAFEHINYDHPFYSKIVQIPDNTYVNKFMEKEMESVKQMGEKAQEIFLKIAKSTIKNDRELKFKITDSIYALEKFFKTVDYPEGWKKEQHNDWKNLLKGIDLSFEIEMIKKYTEVIEKCALDNEWTKTNKYDFNDLDNKIWIEKDYLCLTTQNDGCIIKTGKDLEVIMIDYKGMKEHQSIHEIFEKIKNKTLNDTENRVLRLEEGQISYADIYCIDNVINTIEHAAGNLLYNKLIESIFLENEKLLTADEYAIKSIANYPGLYLKNSYEESKHAVMEHVFNVIGTGSSEFKEYIKGIPVEYSKIENLFGDKKVYERKVNEKLKIEFDEKEGSHLINKNSHWNPYPNFQKKYSVVHSEVFKDVDLSWKKAAFDYYKKAKEYFNDEKKFKDYHSYFPNENLNKKQKKTINEMKNRFEHLTEEQISKNYEVEFIGKKNNDSDIIHFMNRWWEKDKKKINEFIDETLKMLECDLVLNSQSKKSMKS